MAGLSLRPSPGRRKKAPDRHMSLVKVEDVPLWASNSLHQYTS